MVVSTISAKLFALSVMVPATTSTTSATVLQKIITAPVAARFVKYPASTPANRPIRRRKRRYILTTVQSGAGSANIFSRQSNQAQEARIYSHDDPIRRRKRGHILTTDHVSQ
eukprot:9503878-Pyramimonas_sp.AAC.1